MGEGRGSGEVRSPRGAMAGSAPAQVGFRKGPGPLLSRLASRTQLELVLCAVTLSLALLLGIAVVALAIQYSRGMEGPRGTGVPTTEGEMGLLVCLGALPAPGCRQGLALPCASVSPSTAHSPRHAFPARSLSQHVPDGCLHPGGQQDPGGPGCGDRPVPGLLPVLVWGLDQEEPAAQWALQVEHLQQYLGPEPGHHEASPRCALGDSQPLAG